MIKTFKLLPYLILWLTFPGTTGAARPTSGDPARSIGWQRLSDEDGIVVYEKEDAATETDAIALRGEAVISGTAGDILAVIKDNDSAPDWMPYVGEKYTLKSISADERIEYTHVKMPWPLTDRYYLNKAKVYFLTNGRIHIVIKSVDHPDPRWLEADKILADMTYADVLLVPADDRTTRMFLEVKTDPKGLLPRWMINMAQRNWPRDLINGIRAQLLRQRSR